MPLDQLAEEHDKKEMSFLDHVEELRKRIIRSALAVVLGAAVSMYFMRDFIFDVIIMGPSRADFWTYRTMCSLGRWMNAEDLICIDKLDMVIRSQKMTGQFTMFFTSSIVCGFILGFPVIIYQLWNFIKPALRAKERRGITWAIISISLLFISGVLFGYYIVAPMAINFLANFKLSPSIENIFDISDYISILLTMVFISGLVFQLPVIVYVLSLLGLMTPSFMRKYRKHAIVIIMILAAVLTPSPDIFSQLLVALPMILLYEVSIYLSARVQKRKQKELDKALS